MAAANKAKWDNWYKECREEARKEFGGLKADPIFLAGLMLYWGEGERVLKSSKVRLGNSDPEMLKVFYLFLIRIGIPTSKITARLILYPDLNIETQLMYWSKSLKIPLSQFIKSAVIHGKHPEKRLSSGVCILSICSRELKEKVLTWIYLYSVYLQNAQIIMYNTES